MKTKHTVLLAVASLTFSVCFGQVKLNLGSTTRAATKITANTQAAVNAATKATVVTENATARVHARAELKASQQARLHANENSVVSETGLNVNVNSKSAAEKSKAIADKSIDKIESTKQFALKKTGDVKSNLKAGAEKLKHSNVESKTELKSETQMKTSIQ